MQSTATLPLYRLDGSTTATFPTYITNPSTAALFPAARTAPHRDANPARGYTIHPNPASPSRRLPLSFLASAQPIPPSLSLAHVLADDLCAPLTLRDFFRFLAEEDRATENLAFVLWFRDYERRWDALPEEERARAEELDPREEWAKFERERAGVTERERRERVAREREKAPRWEEGEAPWESISLDDLGGHTFADPLGVHPHPHSRSSSQSSDGSGPDPVDLTDQARMDAETLQIAPWMTDEVGERDRRRMEEIGRRADEELQRTVRLLMRDNLPCREEVVQTVQRFLTPLSPLALTSAHIPAVLLTLRRTTHPTSFLPLYRELLTTLTLDAHPRFVRSALANTRTPLRLALYALAIGLYLLGGVALGLACVLVPRVGRAWRAASIPLVWAGLALSLCLVSGVCPMVFGTKRRQLAAWETWADAAAPGAGDKAQAHGNENESDSGIPTGTAVAGSEKPNANPCPQHRTGRRFPAGGILHFVYNDWWAAHPAARTMQNGVLRGAAVG
ncbi:hypothetical protein CALCODRAFT_22114 [Calocera cornea HHB12733]|uniref:RGS domain-containing protein n=1 Tax=Calocera cornea HHB12733 TaxID=1353952 RepID=A0A165E547_9BASI|nr:hypothetical protein CALCODRAFT_22114 [Calocera cornea HHB12733]